MSFLPPAPKIALAWLGLALVLGAARGAEAAGEAPGAAERQRAADLYDRAVALYDSGKYAEAARAFYEADVLSPSSDALSSAIAAARLGHDDLLVARAAQRAVQRESSDPKLAGDARAALAEAEAHLARVDLTCRPAPCTVSIESSAVPEGRHYLLPGTRLLGATFGSERVEQRATLAAGALYAISLSPAPVAATAPQPRTRLDEPQRASKPLPAWTFYAGAGASLVLGGLTVWSGVDALHDVDHFETTRAAGDRSAALSSVRRTDLLLAGTLLMTGLTSYAAIRWVNFGVAPQRAGAVVTWSGKL